MPRRKKPADSLPTKCEPTAADSAGLPAVIPRRVDPAAVHQVFLWIVQGATEYQVRESIAQEFPAENGDALIVAAVDKIGEAANYQPETMRAWCIEAYRELYRKMFQIGDFAGALRAVKQLADMMAKG